MSVLSQDHFKFDGFTVMDTVLMGYKELWDVTQERNALYAKEDFNEEDGMKVAELEEKFANMGGYDAESNAGVLLSQLGMPDAKQRALRKRKSTRHACPSLVWRTRQPSA